MRKIWGLSADSVNLGRNLDSNLGRDSTNLKQNLDSKDSKQNPNSSRIQIAFFIAGIAIFLIDQIIKIIILHYATFANPIWQSQIIDIVLVFNKGVAFSLGSFFGAWLKWILLALLCVMIVLILKSEDFFSDYYLPLGMIIGAGFGNLVDRFTHEGVVDYIFWHFGFNFAVFNFADSVINICIFYMICHYIFCQIKAKK
ncbi:signal peptidase II [Helicobacter sp. 16-1353]|uniref:signal peptidase II n=1 Tax=Helicobacter sp. 16-1353 TaxID=2004996 RepID=UPI0015EF8114|nr:signal peptidase II [Helicobacter sp. 16-1353]